MKIKKFKLNALASEMLQQKEMNALVGGVGNECSCACYYQGHGGANTNDNKMANYAYGYDSTKRGSCIVAGYSYEVGNHPVVFPKEN